MLDRTTEHDVTWRWEDFSIPMEKPIMTPDEVERNEIYTKRISERLSTVHIILFIQTDKWIEKLGNLHRELENCNPKNRPNLPVISILPIGMDVSQFNHEPPSEVVVNWNADSIIKAIRLYAIPASVDELDLTVDEQEERTKIITALVVNNDHMGKTAKSLRIGLRTLRKKRIRYVIR